MAEITTIGLDLAKNWFQVHGADAHGRAVLRKKLARGKVLAFFANLPPCLVGPPVPLGAGCVADGAAVGGWRPAPTPTPTDPPSRVGSAMRTGSLALPTMGPRAGQAEPRGQAHAAAVPQTLREDQQARRCRCRGNL